MRYRLIEGEPAHHGVSQLARCWVCRAKTTTRGSGGRGSPTPRWIETITQIHQNSRGIYGAPRIHAELREDQVCGWPGGAAVGCHQRRRIELTRRDSTAGPALDLAQRNFHAVGPDRLWIADLIHVPMSWLVPGGGAGRVLPWARRVRPSVRRVRRRR
ncbi:IS3 family transposase [Carbonactinospora thermoautotrophica]|uniref:IS3 family transposase n=1 Tax=Carbonactinospora thermoautotrophica TaxID=1469144 RepID=UPI000A485375|nr:IS3 family transposase [Carbonactinospora thermoautotrophica]